MDSEEDAAELLARGQAEQFGMRDWTHTRELLTVLVEEIRSLHSSLIAINNRGRGFKVSPLPRPVTAIDRVERRQRQARHLERVRMVLPDSS